MADIFTSAGEEFVTDLITGATTPPSGYWVGWGTGTAAAAKGDVELVAQVGNRATATSETQPTADKAQWVRTLTATKSMSISEAGLFTTSATTAGDFMVISSSFTGIALATDDQITFTISLEMT